MEQQNQNEKNILYREGMSLKNAGYILAPMLIYYLVHDVAKYLLSYLVFQGVSAAGTLEELTQVQSEVSAIVGGASMLIAAVVISPLYKKNDPDRIWGKQESIFQSFGLAKKILLTGALILQAGFLAMGLNLLMELSGFVAVSKTAQQTASAQFSVIWPIGIILYGVISPFAEELLFRGLLQYRLRKSFASPLAIFLAALFFGLYHANLVQGVYGLLMGLILGYLFEATGKLWVSIIYHSAANLFVFLVGTFSTSVPAYRWPNCIIYLLISGLLTAGIFTVIKKTHGMDTL